MGFRNLRNLFIFREDSMEKTTFLPKLTLIIFLISLAGLTSLHALTQQDINTFISFANSVKKIAETKKINTTGISIEEYYITVIEMAYTELEKLFSDNNWSFEDIEKILYPTGLIMSFRNQIKEEYIIEILAESGITKSDIDIVLKNADKLAEFFVSIDLDYPDMADIDLTDPEMENYTTDDYTTNDYTDNTYDVEDYDQEDNDNQENTDNEITDDPPPPPH